MIFLKSGAVSMLQMYTADLHWSKNWVVSRLLFVYHIKNHGVFFPGCTHVTPISITVSHKHWGDRIVPQGLYVILHALNHVERNRIIWKYEGFWTRAIELRYPCCTNSTESGTATELIQTDMPKKHTDIFLAFWKAVEDKRLLCSCRYNC